MLKVLKNREVALLSVGQLLSQSGDWLLLVAVPFYVYELTGSALSTGAVFAAELVPRLLFAPVAGVLADRWDRRRTMVATDLGRALVVCGLFAVTPDRIWLVYVVTLAESTLSQLFIPARAAVLPSLVRDEGELLPANGLASAIENLTRIAGPPIGGALFALSGIGWVTGIDAATYALSALCIALIRMPGDAANQTAETTLAAPRQGLIRGVWSELGAGLAMVRSDSVVVGLFAVFAVASVGQGVITPLLVPLAEEILRADAAQLGLLMGAQGLGALAVTPFAGLLGTRLQPRALISVGFAGGGLAFLGMVRSGSVLPGLGFMFAVGAFIVLVMISAQTLVQIRVPGPMLGRAFGALVTAMTAASLLGTVLAGVLVGTLGLRFTLNLGGGVFLVGALVALGLAGDQPKSDPAALSSTQAGTSGTD